MEYVTLQKHQELEARMDEGFYRVDRKFDELTGIMLKSFDGVYDRIDGLDRRMNNIEARFDSMENRFERRFDNIESTLSLITTHLGITPQKP